MKNINDRYVIFSIVLFVFLFLSVTQTLTSGYHFIDDHEIIRIKHDLNEETLMKVAKAWVKEDMTATVRFRPLYIVHRVLETWLFGSDFFLWSLYNGLLWCVTLIFFYLGVRNLRFNITESVIFLVISFIGPQTEIWWRLGPQESLGVTFLSLSFYFLSVSVNGIRYHINNILYIIFIILASLCKESFILIIPAFIVLKIWYEKVHLPGSLKEALLKNGILLIPLTVALLEIIYIKYYVGTYYSGVNDETKVVINNIWHACLSFIRTYLNLVIAGIILLIISRIIKKRVHRIDFLLFIFFALIIIPNIFLYARSGLTGRYLLPTSIGLAFFIAASIKEIDVNPLWYKETVYGVILVSFLLFLIDGVKDAVIFSKEGRETSSLLSAISANHGTGKEALLIANPVDSYEASVSLKIYLYCEDGIDLYGYCIIDEKENADVQEYVDGWKSYFSGKLYENLESRPELVIFLNSQLVEKFFDNGPLVSGDYEAVESGSYTYSLLKAK